MVDCLHSYNNMTPIYIEGFLGDKEEKFLDYLDMKKNKYNIFLDLIGA